MTQEEYLKQKINHTIKLVSELEESLKNNTVCECKKQLMISAIYNSLRNGSKSSLNEINEHYEAMVK